MGQVHRARFLRADGSSTKTVIEGPPCPTYYLPVFDPVSTGWASGAAAPEEAFHVRSVALHLVGHRIDEDGAFLDYHEPAACKVCAGPDAPHALAAENRLRYGPVHLMKGQAMRVCVPCHAQIRRDLEALGNAEAAATEHAKLIGYDVYSDPWFWDVERQLPADVWARVDPRRR